MAKISLDNVDPFFSETQDGKVDVKCSKALEDALRSAATQMKMKYPDLVRTTLKQMLIGLAMEGKVRLPDISAKDLKKASGE